MLADRFTHLDTRPARTARAGLPYADSNRNTPAVPRSSCISRWRHTCSCRNHLWKTRIIHALRFCIRTKTNGTYWTQVPATGRTGHSGCRSPPRRTEAGARLRLANTASCHYIFRCFSFCRKGDEILTIQAGRERYFRDGSSPTMQIEPCANSSS